MAKTGIRRAGIEWDGPLSLFDMMDAPEPEVLACMDNYHLRLIAPPRMDDEEIMKFRPSLREVLRLCCRKYFYSGGQNIKILKLCKKIADKILKKRIF